MAKGENNARVGIVWVKCVLYSSVTVCGVILIFLMV